MPLIRYAEPRIAQPSQEVGPSPIAAQWFSHFWSWSGVATPTSFLGARSALTVTGTALVGGSAGGLGLAISSGALTVAGDPFATSTGTYLWFESARSVDTNGSVIAHSRYSASNADSGGIEIRITATDILVLRSQQAVTLNAANCRTAGGLNAAAVSIAGNNGRHAAFANGRLVTAATPTTTYTHGTSGIGNGRPADAVSLIGPLHFLLYSPTVVPDAVLQEFTANPWLVFPPIARWVPVTAGGTTYNVSLSESASASDAASASGAFAAALTEAASASDSVAAAASLAAAIGEGVTAADVLAASAALQAAVAEAVAASDSAATGPVVTASLTETASAADAITTAAVLLAAVSEAAAVGDAATAARQTLALLTEPITAADVATASLAGVYSVSVAEAVAAVDVLTAAIGGQAIVRDPLLVTLRARPPQLAALLRRPARGLGPFKEN